MAVDLAWCGGSFQGVEGLHASGVGVRIFPIRSLHHQVPWVANMCKGVMIAYNYDSCKAKKSRS